MIVNMDRLYNHILLIVQAMTLILIFFSIVARFNHILLDAFFFILYIYFAQMACKILVPLPGIELWSSAVKVQSPNHWTTWEVPQYI